MNKLFAYRCCEYIKMTQGHRVSVWGGYGLVLKKLHSKTQAQSSQKDTKFIKG